MTSDVDLTKLVEAAGWPIVPLVPAAVLGFVTSGVPVDIGPARYAGLVLVVAGIAFWLWAIAALLFGGDTPVGTPPKELVSSGPYGYSRNPMFLGVVAAAFGEGIFFSSAVGVGLTVVVWWLFDRIVVSWEEAQARRSLGEDYERYCERVPRWIGPV